MTSDDRKLGAICTWVIAVGHYRFVHDRHAKSLTLSVMDAHVWLDERDAMTYATTSPWLTTMGEPIGVRRARP